MRQFGVSLLNGSLSAIAAAITLAAAAPSWAQLDLELFVDVTSAPDGMFKYEYLLENFFTSSVDVNTFVLDVGDDADITEMMGPEGWEGDFDPSEATFEVAWVTDPEDGEFNIGAGQTGTFSFLSPLAPATFDYFVAKLEPDFTIPEGGDAGGMIDAPGVVPETPDADCNGDGIVDLADANCACTSDQFELQDVLNELGLLLGDADGDGEIQFPDFVVLANNFGNSGTYTDGDFDCDGEVQFGDFVILANGFGQSSEGAQMGGQVAAAASHQTAAVPEPATFCCLMIGGLLLLSSGRRVV